jgi:cyanate lyase
MRYHVTSLLWATLAVRRIRFVELAAHTPNTQQWLSKVYLDRRTVSEAWAQSVADFLDLPFDALFTPAIPVGLGTAQYQIAS